MHIAQRTVHTDLSRGDHAKLTALKEDDSGFQVTRNVQSYSMRLSERSLRIKKGLNGSSVFAQSKLQPSIGSSLDGCRRPAHELAHFVRKKRWKKTAGQSTYCSTYQGPRRYGECLYCVAITVNRRGQRKLNLPDVNRVSPTLGFIMYVR